MLSSHPLERVRKILRACSGQETNSKRGYAGSLLQLHLLLVLRMMRQNKLDDTEAILHFIPGRWRREKVHQQSHQSEHLSDNSHCGYLRTLFFHYLAFGDTSGFGHLLVGLCDIFTAIASQSHLHA